MVSRTLAKKMPFFEKKFKNEKKIPKFVLATIQKFTLNYS
jgi:hypothetical protein